MPTVLRQIEPEDNLTIAKLIRDVFVEFGIDRSGTVFSDPATDHLYELFQTEKSVYWVAKENGKIIGGCGVFPTPGLPEGCAELVKFYIDNEQRGKGIGKLLFQLNQNSARSLGYKQLYLESFPELATAINIYKTFGFKYLKAPLGNSGHYACTIWMLKNL